MKVIIMDDNGTIKEVNANKHVINDEGLQEYFMPCDCNCMIFIEHTVIIDGLYYCLRHANEELNKQRITIKGETLC